MITVDRSVLRGEMLSTCNVLMHRSCIVNFEQLSGVYDNKVEVLLEPT